jgi:hypothetical protein
MLKFRRMSYNGITLAFQANDRGSIPLIRSKDKIQGDGLWIVVTE